MLTLEQQYEYRFGVPYAGITLVVWTAANVKEARQRLKDVLNLPMSEIKQFSYVKCKKGVYR